MVSTKPILLSLLFYIYYYPILITECSYSSENSVHFGVSQGSVLGPILFSLFINDLPLHVKNTSVDRDILADDTTPHTSGKYI